ncbi:hypothetical protein FMUND_4426 [Fusarium mundagurra]|uniref:Uncharacterized protein n=1 Tax=Fusarium mundagurra TaxID=1567541 RepID=A0A8H5YYK1_9HYPO|nr:hypothetical protein FMUND_4426 [Fusarium mundagurra]
MPQSLPAPNADLITKVKIGSIDLSDLAVENCPELLLHNISGQNLRKSMFVWSSQKQDIRQQGGQGSCANDERETWEFQTLVPVDSELHTPATGGSNFLRNIARLGKKAMRPSGSDPGEAQRLMGRYRDGLKLFSLHYENDVQTENRLKRIEGEVARIATAVEQITTSHPRELKARHTVE